MLTDTLPRVSGRHRDRALARARRARCVELKLEGKTYQQIADELGYKSKGSVYSIVQKAQLEELGELAGRRRQQELAALDAILISLWPMIDAGNLEAAQEAHKIILSQCRLLGLMPSGSDAKSSWPSCQGQATVVLRADDCRIAGCDAHGHL